MVGLTRATAIETARHGITLNAVAPGWIATGSSTDHEIAQGRAVPVGRPGTPGEVAALVAFLASPVRCWSSTAATRSWKNTATGADIGLQGRGVPVEAAGETVGTAEAAPVR